VLLHHRVPSLDYFTSGRLPHACIADRTFAIISVVGEYMEVGDILRRGLARPEGLKLGWGSSPPAGRVWVSGVSSPIFGVKPRPLNM